MEAVKTEFKLYSPKGGIQALYIGGGTPTILPANDLESLFVYFQANGKFAEGAEITCEGSPETLSREKIDLLSRHATRASIGVQSFEDEILREVGRRHTALQAEEKIREVMGSISFLNIDLMFGLPHQTLEHWFHSLKIALELSPQSISTYRFSMRPGCSYAPHYSGDELGFAHEQLARLMYLTGREILGNAGYEEKPWMYFVKPGFGPQAFEERWGKRSLYLGLGVNSYSASKDYLAVNIEDRRAYTSAVLGGSLPIEKSMRLNEWNKAIQLIWGVFKSGSSLELSELERFGEEIFSSAIAALGNLAERGLVLIANSCASLTEAGSALMEWIPRELQAAIKQR